MKCLSVVLGLAGLLSFSSINAGESWQTLELPGEPAMVGMGELPFPDGQRAVWASTEEGTFRRLAGQWLRWPIIEGDNPVVRDLLVAPDENGLTTWWLATANGLLTTGDGQSFTHRSTANTALADDDIRVLQLSQSSDGQPEVWIGSHSGLTIWRMGQWEAVLTRPDGFQGGAVSVIRGLFHNGQRQTWVAGPAGLSRFQAGQWQRWAAGCLRGQHLNAIQTLEQQGEIRLFVGTDRALLELSLDDPAFCQPLVGPMPQAGPVLALARDRHERLYVMRAGRVERFAPASTVSADWSWTYFDQRDGLAEHINWQGGQRLDAEGRLWAGSRDGLWTIAAVEPPGQPERPPTLELGDEQSRIGAGADRPLKVGSREPELMLLPGPSARPHALRFRFRSSPQSSFGPWQHETSFNPGPLAFGRHDIGVEMADEHGRIHGSYEFGLHRPWPTHWLAALIASIVMLMIAGAWLLRRRG